MTAITNNETQLWTVPQVANRRGVHPHTVRRWIAAGQVEVVRLPPSGAVRIPDAELQRLLGADRP